MFIHQMNVKTAFLNDNLEVEIDMDQSEGFIAKVQENKICKLVKPLYDLKQAPKQWHQKFNKVVAQFGFIIHEHDKCIYSKNFVNDYIILCLYVDDILILETSLDAIQMIKDSLSKISPKSLTWRI